MQPIPPDTPEPRPEEESIVLGLYVKDGMPLSMAGPLLRAIGSMYPASMWTTDADDLALVPPMTTLAIRIPLADIHGYASDEDDDDGGEPEDGYIDEDQRDR